MAPVEQKIFKVTSCQCWFCNLVNRVLGRAVAGLFIVISLTHG